MCEVFAANLVKLLNADMKCNLNWLHHFSLHHFAALYCLMLRNHQNPTSDLYFVFCAAAATDVKKNVSLNLWWVSFLTHRVWSCPISGFMDDWPVWAECFQWCGLHCELQRRPESLSRRHERAADVFGVILATAVAWLSCLTQRPNVSKRGGGSWVT